MIIQKHGCVLDVDIEKTLQYSREHSICDCDEDRNLYAQIREKFPDLTAFLAELGLLIERPDETGLCAVDDYIDYHFVSYTVIGNILESDKSILLFFLELTPVPKCAILTVVVTKIQNLYKI